ncbi:MAG: DUF3618 domain-containing protein [Chthoniobacteraceae bacterium]
MAGSTEHDKHAIVAELAAARARLSATGDALRHSLDVPARAKESFGRHKPVWLSGAAIAGFVLSKLPSRKKTIIVERATGKVLGAAGKLGAIFSVAKFAINFARPLMSEIAGGGIAEILKRFQNRGKPAPHDDTPRP